MFSERNVSIFSTKGTWNMVILHHILNSVYMMISSEFRKLKVKFWTAEFDILKNKINNNFTEWFIILFNNSMLHVTNDLNKS